MGRGRWREDRIGRERGQEERKKKNRPSLLSFLFLMLSALVEACLCRSPPLAASKKKDLRRGSGRGRSRSASRKRSPKGGGSGGSSTRKAQQGASFIDRLQRDSHDHELDHTNTSAAAFVALSLAQLPVLWGLCWGIFPSPSLPLSMAVIQMGGHWLGFFMSVLINSVKYFDIVEDITYFASFLYGYRMLEAPSPRQTLIFVLGMVWCIRICAFVGYRVMVRGSDWRFDKLAKGIGAYNFFAWTCGGTWCFMNGMAVWYVAGADQTKELGHPLDIAGVALFVFGICFEMIADVQKYSFNAAYKSGTNKKWISTGVWALSRHPNYFGETTLWLGVSLIALSGKPSLYSLSVCAITPIWSFVFLLFTSLMLLEKRADKRWGGQKQYEEYKSTTNVWLPKFW